MTSSDNIMLFIQLENEKIRSDIRELHNNIQATNIRIDAMDSRITDLQNSISSYFMLATIFITFIGIIISVGVFGIKGVIDNA